jgi:hypothetical protein
VQFAKNCSNPTSATEASSGAFLKIEDINRSYRPILATLQRFPSVNFDADPRTGYRGVFDDIHSKFVPAVGLQNRLAKKSRKSAGFRECCNVFYEKMKDHVISAHHRNFARNSNNYFKIDQLIQSLPSLQDEFGPHMAVEVEALDENHTCEPLKNIGLSIAGFNMECTNGGGLTCSPLREASEIDGSKRLQDAAEVAKIGSPEQLLGATEKNSFEPLHEPGEAAGAINSVHFQEGAKVDSLNLRRMLLIQPT